MNIYLPPISLSSQASNILKEVESLYGKEVRWQERSDLYAGDMCALRDTPFPIIQYKNISVVDENGCVHELLHLKLAKLGFPGVQKIDRNENIEERTKIIIMLNNLFEHAVIFPKLVQLGYSPFDAEEKGANAQLTEISPPNSLFPDSNPLLRNLCALFYARVFLDCRSQKIRDHCNSIFTQQSFSVSKALGLRVIEVVQQYAKNDVSKFRMGLLECISVLQENRFIQIEIK